MNNYNKLIINDFTVGIPYTIYKVEETDGHTYWNTYKNGTLELDCQTPTIKLKAQDKIHNTWTAGDGEIPLWYFIGRIPPSDIKLDVSVWAMYGLGGGENYLPGNRINITPTNNKIILTDNGIVKNKRSVYLQFNEVPGNNEFIKCTFAEDNGKSYDIEIFPEEKTPELKLQKASTIAGNAHETFNTVEIPFSIKFDYTSTDFYGNNFFWGNTKKQLAIPTDSEWTKCVESNIADLQNALSEYCIDIQEQRDFSTGTGKLVIKPISGKEADIKAFEKTFTYTLTYKVDDKIATTAECKLNFNFKPLQIICNDLTTIELLVKERFEHEIKFTLKPEVCSAQNVKCELPKGSFWFWNSDDWKINGDVSVDVITGRDGLKKNEGIVKISGIVNELPNPDGWTWDWLSWLGAPDKNTSEIYLNYMEDEKIITSKTLHIKWEVGLVKFNTNSPLEISYSANKPFEVELPVSAVIEKINK